MTTVYTYTSNDGVTRTRCRAHIERTGPYAPHPTKHHRTAQEGICCVCDHLPKPDIATEDPDED